MGYRQPYTLFKRANGIWYWRSGDDPSRKARSTGQKLKHLAKAHVEALLSLGGTEITFEEFARDMFDWDKSPYLKRRRELSRGRRISEGTAACRHGHVKNYLIPQWGKMPLHRIRLGDFEHWLDSLELSNQSKNHILFTARLIFKEAVRRGHLKVSPVAEIEALDPASRTRDVLTPEELEGLFPRDMDKFLEIWPVVDWRGSKICYGIPFALAVSGGLRSGELRALRWKCVSWENSGVAVLTAKTYRDVESAPKWGSIRPVLLPARTMDLLRWWFERCEHQDPEDYVFPTRDRRSLSQELKRGLARAGVGATGRFIDVHSLRHCYNTYMRGLIEDEALRTFTGHRSAKMTEHYDHAGMMQRISRFAGLQSAVDRFPGLS